MHTHADANFANNDPEETGNVELPVLSHCPNPDGITWRTVWYRPTCATLFSICSFCYHRHISSTSHADLFEAVWEDGNNLRQCLWNAPRVMSYLAANDWDAIKALMVERAALQGCKGTAGHTGPDASRWYSPTGAWEIPGFVICETCFYDLVEWNHLRKYFTTTPQIKSDEGTWACDASLPLMKEGLSRAINSPDHWESLHLLFRRRLEHPSCAEMKRLQACSTHWYSSKNVPELIVCTACYLDHFVLDHAGSWELRHLTPEQEQQQWDCAMQAVHIRYPWFSCRRVGRNNNTDEYDGFEAVARMILNSPPCDTNNVRNTTWFKPKNYHGDSFAICRRCLISFTVAPGFSEHFEQTSFSHLENRTCDFNSKAPRFLTYLGRYEAAVVLGDFSFFSEFVSEYAEIPDCPRNQPWRNRRWYGKGGFLACELCYKQAIEGTSLAGQLECGIVPTDGRCQMYSPRMRNLWAQACRSYDLVSFLEYAKQRMDVYLLLDIEKTRIQAEELDRLRQKHTLLLASTINRGTEGICAVFDYNSSTRYGNSELGYNWYTPEGVEAERQFQQALGIDVVHAGDAFSRVSPLIRRWAELE